MLKTFGKLGTSDLQSFAICSRNFGSLELLDSWSSSTNHLQRFWLSAYYFIPRVPRWIASLCNLIDLNINIKRLTNEDMQILRDLLCLLCLDPKEGMIVIH
uniref:Disease resistance R13L4/SHOC-2-like LRR domain-containing protein n=1 Tax=Oryza brachyantha TaxID=4533 RepID=J3N900_ORYBR